MRRVSVLVFEILEKVWQTRDCALIDMKIEFGVDDDGKWVLIYFLKKNKDHVHTYALFCAQNYIKQILGQI